MAIKPPLTGFFVRHLTLESRAIIQRSNKRLEIRSGGIGLQDIEQLAELRKEQLAVGTLTAGGRPWTMNSSQVCSGSSVPRLLAMC